MRTLIRYTVFFAVLVGLAFASVTIEVDGRTLFERLRDEGLTPWLEEAKDSWASWTATDPEEKRSRKKPRPRKVEKTAKARRRVAILREATEKAAPKQTRIPSKKRKTRVDPHISPKQKKALDELVSNRVGGR